MAHKLEYLLDFCNTDLQRRVVQMFIEGRTGPEIAQASGMEHRSGPDTMLRRVKRRAAACRCWRRWQHELGSRHHAPR